MNPLFDSKNKCYCSTLHGVPYKGLIYQNPIFKYNFENIINNDKIYKSYLFDFPNNQFEKWDLHFSHRIIERNVEMYYFSNINKESSLLYIGIPKEELENCIKELISYDCVCSGKTTNCEKGISVFIFTIMCLFLIGILCFFKDASFVILLVIIIYIIGVIGVIKYEN